MLAVLKQDGRLASVMPHGVLFRGGEEREGRKYFIDRGYLEAIIGLPSNLFYGTGIPACILVLNKAGASERTNVLFINGDREYGEGKAQLKVLKSLAGNLYTELQALPEPPQRSKKSYYCTEGFSQKEPQFNNGQRLVALAAQVGYVSEYITPLKEAIAA